MASSFSNFPGENGGHQDGYLRSPIWKTIFGMNIQNILKPPPRFFYPFTPDSSKFPQQSERLFLVSAPRFLTFAFAWVPGAFQGWREHPKGEGNIPRVKGTSQGWREHPKGEGNIPRVKGTSQGWREHPKGEGNIPRVKGTSQGWREHPKGEGNIPRVKGTSQGWREHPKGEGNIPRVKGTSQGWREHPKGEGNIPRKTMIHPWRLTWNMSSWRFGESIIFLSFHGWWL